MYLRLSTCLRFSLPKQKTAQPSGFHNENKPRESALSKAVYRSLLLHVMTVVRGELRRSRAEPDLLLGRYRTVNDDLHCSSIVVPTDLPA